MSCNFLPCFSDRTLKEPAVRNAGMNRHAAWALQREMPKIHGCLREALVFDSRAEVLQAKDGEERKLGGYSQWINLIVETLKFTENAFFSKTEANLRVNNTKEHAMPLNTQKFSLSTINTFNCILFQFSPCGLNDFLRIHSFFIPQTIQALSRSVQVFAGQIFCQFLSLCLALMSSLKPGN